MPPTTQENERYRIFVQDQIKALGSTDFDPEAILWHYTTGAGFLGIMQSGSIHATQAACLNDSTEIRYANRIYRNAIESLQNKHVDDARANAFITKLLKYSEEPPEVPSHGPSRFFVACFSSKEDDLTQWRSYGGPGGENGYALGFRARGLFNAPFGVLVRVNYRKEDHERVASEIADATLRFYLEGLEADPSRTEDKWTEEFLVPWNDWINRIAPVVKDSCFQEEQEFRIVHELDVTELGDIRFVQKETMLSRHLPLYFPAWLQTRYPILPLVTVKVGPGRQQALSAVSVKTLIKQMGYGDLEVTVSKRPLQRA
jgi:hypothetical protein